MDHNIDLTTDDDFILYSFVLYVYATPDIVILCYYISPFTLSHSPYDIIIYPFILRYYVDIFCINTPVFFILCYIPLIIYSEIGLFQCRFTHKSN